MAASGRDSQMADLVSGSLIEGVLVRHARFTALAAASLLALGMAAHALPATAAPIPVPPAASAAASPAAPAPAGLFGNADPTYDAVMRQSTAIMGLVAVGHRVPAAAAAWLIAQQCKDGSFASYRADPNAPCPRPDITAYTGPDSNSSASALMALALLAEGKPSRDAKNKAAQKARAWLSAQQLPGGAWPWLRGLSPDAISTAMSVTALGRDRASTRWLARQVDAEADCVARFQPGAAADPLSTVWTFLSTQGSPTFSGSRSFDPSECSNADAARSTGAWIAATLIAGDGTIASAWDPSTIDWNSTALGTLGMTQRNGSAEALRLGLAALQAHVDDYVVTAAGDSPGSLGTLLMVAHAAKVDPRDFGGHDLIARLLATMQK